MATRVEAPGDVPAHLLCPVCLEAPLGRIGQCVNGHILCMDPCFLAIQAARWGHRPALCPTCRVNFPDPLPRNLIAEQTIAALPATCSKCLASMTRGELTAHAATACEERLQAGPHTTGGCPR